MSRPREFDEAAALDAALQCFWQTGYEATSLRDLTAAMGLTAPSLYNAFGDKEQLFARTLERYLNRTTRGRLRRLEGALPPKQAIHRFFAEIIAHSVGDKQRKGCFLVNSAIEVAPHHPPCRAVVAEQFEDIQAFFERCIRAAQIKRTIPSSVKADDVAPMLLGALIGIRVLARTTSNRATLESLVRPVLALLDPPRRKRS
jgi:TetR/AcrR family transcriptional repressor of nem operon